MGNSPEAELKKMSEELSVFGGSEKEFINIYKNCKQEPFDFCFLNIQDMTARRNFDEKTLWSANDNYKKKKDDIEKTENDNINEKENKTI